jgi:hypothetical protein
MSTALSAASATALSSSAARQAQRRARGDAVVALQRQLPRRQRGVGAAVRIVRDAQRLAQLLKVLLVRQRGRLVEPLGHHQLGGGAFDGVAVHVGQHVHERLRTARDGGRAKSERQPQGHRPLVQLDAAHAHQGRCIAHNKLSRMPRT